MAAFKAYLELTKPERTMTSVLTAAAGFLFASKWHITSWMLVLALVGSTLVAASACVLNNLIDRGLDKKMQRTRKRVLVAGKVSKNGAIVLATVLGIVGFCSLAYVNWLTFIVGVVAFIGYVVLYGAAKRFSAWGTLVGTIPGGAPMVAGYTAAVNRLDVSVWLLFLIMAAWQMAHFYAIAIYRHDDYKAAGLPVWSVRYGIANTKYHIVGGVVLFLIFCAMLTFFGQAGWLFLVVMIAFGFRWLWSSLGGFKADTNNAVWARDMFTESLVVVMVLSVMISIGSIVS